MTTFLKTVCISSVSIFAACCATSSSAVGLSNKAELIDADEAFRGKLQAAREEIAKRPDARQISPEEYFAEVQRIVGLSDGELLTKLIGLTEGTQSDIIYVPLLGMAAAKVSPEEMIDIVAPIAGHERYAGETAQDLLLWNFHAHGVTAPERTAELIRGYGPEIPRGLFKALAYLQYDARSVAETNAHIFEVAGERTRQLWLIDRFHSQFDWKSVRDISNANAERLLPLLKPLVESDRWWVRYYAAQALNRQWNMRYPELVDPLCNDPEPLVRDLMRFENDFRKYRRGDDTRGRTQEDRTRLLNEAIKAGALPGMENDGTRKPGSGAGARPAPAAPNR